MEPIRDTELHFSSSLAPNPLAPKTSSKAKKSKVKTSKKIRGKHKGKPPRVLVVTPEITYLPEGMGNMSQRLSAKAGGLADVSASLVAALYELGADVHVALPNYRTIFHIDIFHLHEKELRNYHQKLPNDHIHLAEDPVFYYRERVYSGYQDESVKVALAFQREVINHIVPLVDPDLIHCNDWMTGLIPAMARRRGIKSLFTVHNIHTQNVSLGEIENRGIDVAEFWMNLFFTGRPASYEEAYRDNSVDMLASGIFSAHYINTVSPRFLWEVVNGWHSVVPDAVRHELWEKNHASCATGILNAPDPSNNPVTDEYLVQQYGPDSHPEGKAANKAAFQRELGLIENPGAPLFFWPSRLDPVQKSPQLVAEILYQLVSDYWDEQFQLAVVASGPFQKHFADIARMHGIEERVAVCDFDERLSRRGYAASDFMLMPSLFEPCGLPQMVSPIYGTIPVVHGTGGIYDTIQPLDIKGGTGNGFRFDIYGSEGLRWAIDRAMEFYREPIPIKHAVITRIMRESLENFNHQNVAERYVEIYEEMLDRPLVNRLAVPV